LTVIFAPLAIFLPIIPSPKINSYFSSCTSWSKYISDEESTFIILSTKKYSIPRPSSWSVVSSIYTFIVEVSIPEFSNTNFWSKDASFVNSFVTKVPCLTKIFENSSHNTAILQHADIHHAIVFRGATNNNGSTITNENTTTFREYGKFVFRTGAINAPVRLTIAANGHIGAPSGSNIYPSSDVRLKKNVVNLDKGLDTIKSLRPVSFNWIDNYIEEEKDPLYGFIAQEVEAVDSNLTGLFAEEIKIGEDQENPDQVISDVKRVNEKFIIPILVKALQELTARVETLEAGWIFS